MQTTLPKKDQKTQKNIPQQAENFQFLKVEEFFDNYQNDWAKLGDVKSYNVNTNNDQIELCFQNFEGKDCWLLIKFPTPNSFRLRFNPLNETLEHYPKANTRTIVMDTFDELSNSLDKIRMEKVTENNQIVEYDIIDHEENKKTMRIEINLNPYNLKVYKYKNNKDYFEVMSDCFDSIYYKKRIINTPEGELPQYSCILARNKHLTSKYMGFGEKGGIELCKNGKQLTYFNYDNMRYSIVYGNGPMDEREPLYHSNPFFMEFNRNPDEKCVMGSFIDNASESFIDVGKLDNNKYLMGTMYGEFDCYFFLSNTCEGILDTFSQFVGKTKLKPRFILGYHQGCYGYESYDQSSWNQMDLKSVVESYRECGIPLDGLHVDVDIQKNYCTFTMNEDKFPEDTFDKLAEKGIKCSTNITPVISYLNDDYETYKSGANNDYFIHDQRKENDPFYKGGVYYGDTYGTLGHYTDFGNKEARIWWGQQYKHLYERGLKMVWQDMTTPAIPDNNNPYLANQNIKGPNGQLHNIGQNIESDWRSLPMNLKITDNFLKRYDGDSELSDKDGGSLNYEGKIRNLYSYNLHKATYHGLDNIWYITEHTFIDIDGVKLDESKKIFKELVSKKVILKESHDNLKLYLLNDKWEEKISKCKLDKKADVITLLKQSEKLRTRRENVRNFIIGRGGFTGMHRFAGLWTGDNASTWDFMKINISQILALGISGQSVSGADIGGFETKNDENWADPQLVMRWTMLGSFLSWFRNHYNGKPGKKWFQEPYQYSKDWVIDQVPWNQKHLYKSVLPVCRNYIQIRYKFMQLLYDLMFENTLNSKPIVRPLFLSENDPALFNDKVNYLDTQFSLGKDLLVSPILEQQKSGSDGRRDVYLPVIESDYYGNRWYCYQHNKYKLEEAIAGGSTIDYDASIKYEWGSMNPDDDKHLDFLVPLYVRAGAILPTIELENYVGEKEFNPVTLNVYPGPTGTYSMYQDDGESRSSAHKKNFDSASKGEYRETKITHKYSDINRREIKIEWPHNNYKPNENYFYLSILHDPNENITNPINKIHIQSNNINYNEGDVYCLGKGSTDLANWLNECTDNAWYYNNEINISFIKIVLPEALSNLKEEDNNDSSMPSI
ncbi:MAG: TIM-barrel domain-containing protein, partial [Clostridiales bacterium]